MKGGVYRMLTFPAREDNDIGIYLAEGSDQEVLG